MSSSRRGFLRAIASTAMSSVYLGELARARSLDQSADGVRNRAIRLDRNESPYGASPGAIAAVRDDLSDLGRYPNVDLLLQQIAAAHRTSTSCLLLGCGSTDVLRMAVTSCLGPGKNLVSADHTFSAAALLARAVGSPTRSVPLTREYGYDLERMLAQVDSSVSLVYICNPNNPTGAVVPRSDLEQFVKKLPLHTFIVVDEAYHHYAGESSAYRSFIDKPVDDPRLIVTRTFSIAYGLAAIRLGYGIGAAATIEKLRRSRLPHATSGPAISAGIAALADDGFIRRVVLRNSNERQEFMNQAVARALRPITSHTNFIMMNTRNPAAKVIEHFRQHKILIGPEFTSMNTFVRVSLGTSQEMEEFWRVWELLPNRPTHMH
jgi:histidinol-phosphate aminotransferase